MKSLLFTVCLLLANSTVSWSQQWKIAEGHSIAFSSSDVSGVFKEITGTITFDPANLGTSKLIFKIDVSSISTGNALQNKHAKGEEWFDGMKHPTIEFVSSKIEKSADGYTAIGKLEIKGVKKDVRIPFSFTKKGAKASILTKFSVNRLDYGVGKKGDVSETLKINATIPVIKK